MSETETVEGGQSLNEKNKQVKEAYEAPRFFIINSISTNIMCVYVCVGMYPVLQSWQRLCAASPKRQRAR